MTHLPHLEYENQIEGICAGLDEAGCGPWAGPVVTAAVILSKNYLPSFLSEVRDSKVLTSQKREELYQHIVACGEINWNIGLASVDEIDHFLLRKALPLAFSRAVEGLSIKPDYLLIDGIRDPKLSIPTQLIKKGDQISLSIATASILAKVTRDHIMQKLHNEFPQYGWNKNAGYGTKQHQLALAEFGITCHHRRSYAPIQKYC